MIHPIIKGFHNGFNRLLTQAHPSIWLLIEKMQKYEALSLTKLRNKRIGKEPYRRKDQQKKDEEMKNVVLNYLEDVKNKKEDLLGTLDLIVDALRGFYHG